jgi:hypothetical protein
MGSSGSRIYNILYLQAHSVTPQRLSGGSAFGRVRKRRLFHRHSSWFEKSTRLLVDFWFSYGVVVRADWGAVGHAEDPRMAGKDLLLRAIVPSILFLYILPTLIMFPEAGRMWLADTKNQLFQHSWISSAFMILIAHPGGPMALLQKGISVLGSGAIVATLWSPRDRFLDALLIATLAVGLIASLLVWAILYFFPHVAQEVWQSLEIPDLKGSKGFEIAQDKFFSDQITGLLSFGAVLTGVKLRGGK